MEDLIVLVADKNMEFLVRGLFPRIPHTEQIREFRFKTFVHPYRDPGIYAEADDFLRPFLDRYSYAIVILDHSGCGQEAQSREKIEETIEIKLSQSGWQGRASAIAISPELENWIWVNEIRIKEAISWDKNLKVYDWLHENNLKDAESLKPKKPKQAFEAVLRICRTPRSSSIYHDISSQSSYSQCQDAAFIKMINQIKSWFS